MEMDEPPVGFLPSRNLLDSCSCGRMGRALALWPQTQTGIQTHWVLPFWFIIAKAMAVVLIWFLWCVGRETILMITIVLRRMPCPLAVSQDSNQRRVRILPDLLSWQQLACWEMSPQPSPLWSIYPESSTLQSSWLPSLADQGDPEGHCACLALCTPAFGGPDAKAPPRNLTSSAWWP